MTRLRLLLRNLAYFRLANLAVVAGMAVATAVLAGALMVGDSVRGSLRDLAVQRLGPVDHAVVATRFFPADLADRLRAAEGFSARFADVRPVIQLRGGAGDAEGKRFTGGVQVFGVDPAWIKGLPAVNGLLADELGLSKARQEVTLILPVAGDVPKDSALAKRSREETTVEVPGVAVTTIERATGMLSSFDLAGGQRTPRNLWAPIDLLQRELGQAGKANLLLLDARDGVAAAAAARDDLERMLRGVARLGDYGLSTRRSEAAGEVALNSDATYLLPAVLDAARDAARAAGTSLREVSVYLINNVVVVRDGRDAEKTHYAIAAGISHLDGAPLRDGQVVLNRWAADQLKAKVGDRVRLDYYRRQPDGDLAEVRSDREGVGLLLEVAGIVEMQGLGGDETLTPVYKGITDKADVDDWEPPRGLKIDNDKADREYVRRHRAAPKLFVSMATARRLWGDAFGDVTSVRVPADKAAAFERALLERLTPAAGGMQVRAVRAEQLAAATGSTDFSGLFIGFSFFIIASAGMLVAMLFRLAIEQRARQFGLLGALGFSPKQLRRLALAEGMLLAVVGALVGLAGAVGYTALMMAGLRTWWVGAVGTTALRLHVEPVTLAIGLAGSLLVALLAMAWAAWRVGKAESAALLAGAWSSAGTRVHGPARWVRPAAVGCIVVGVALAGAGGARLLDPKGAFMGGGTLLLAGALLGVSSSLRPGRREAPAVSVPALGFRNAGRARGRSVLTVGLIAFASFVLVAVSAFRQQPPADPGARGTGTGGFRLIVQADAPLGGHPGTPAGQDLLGLALQNDAEKQLWSRATFFPMRSWAGQDMSCLNLTRPTAPTILAVPAALAGRGGFAAARSVEPADNVLSLLGRRSAAQDFVPVVADDEAATFILKLKLGDDLHITDQAGRPRKLRLVGTLSHSIFQGELLMAESDFVELFPSQGGYSTVLVETSAADEAPLRELLGRELRGYAATVEPTALRLARYQEVANTYISTFQTLGSLGLLLGTAGLAVILLRGLVERRAELALLAAIGFGRARRLGLVLAENALLLVLGLGIGAACALVGVLPAILGDRRGLNVAQLALTLGAVLLTGLVVLVIAVWAGGRRIGVGDLRAD